jgi:hypothetical protein
MSEKRNCWEFKNCGFGPRGNKIDDLGICPAARSGKLDGVHNGHNRGRVCWVIAGTLCGGAPQGEFVKKYSTCMNCEFYKMVREEEGANFQITLLLMKRLKAA